MKKYIVIIMVFAFIFLCIGCTASEDYPGISSTQVESVHVWVQGTYNEIQLNEDDMETFVALYNQSQYMGEGTGNVGTPEWGVFVCYKNGDELYINEFNGFEDFEVSLHTSTGKKAWCYINNQELMGFLTEIVEGMG